MSDSVLRENQDRVANATHDSSTSETRRRFVAIAVPITIAGSVYVATLSRWVIPGDPAELVTAAVTLGLAHPTGYPVYLLVAKTATLLLPWLTPELVINGLSSVCTVAMLMVIGRGLVDLGYGGRAIGSSLLLLAFTPSLWQYSTYAEVYTLNGLLMSCVIVALMRPSERERAPRLAAYLVGLSAGTHMTGLLALPGLGVWWALDARRRHERFRFAELIALAGSFLLGATVLLSLLFFDRSDRLNYLHGIEVWRPDLGLNTAWSRFVYIVSARQFGAVAGIPSIFSSSGFFGGVRDVMVELFRDQPVSIVLGVLGLCLPLGRASQGARGLRLYLVILIGLQLLYFATYRRFFQPIFFLPGTIALTFGVANLLERGLHGAARTVASLAVVGWVAFGIVRHYESRDLSHESAPQVATGKVIASLEPDAVVFSTWTSSTLFWFHQWVEGVQPGVEIINALPEEWMGRAGSFAGRPLYFEKIPPGAGPEALVPYRGLHKLITSDGDAPSSP